MTEPARPSPSRGTLAGTADSNARPGLFYPNLATDGVPPPPLSQEDPGGCSQIPIARQGAIRTLRQ
jgi:hypothetical protein